MYKSNVLICILYLLIPYLLGVFCGYDIDLYTVYYENIFEKYSELSMEEFDQILVSKL